MKQTTVLLVLGALAAAHAQTYYFPGALVPPPIPASRSIGGFPVSRPIQFARAPEVQRTPHHSVVSAAEEESFLPEQYKNPFYKNPRIAQALAKESWKLNGEEMVYQREAEKIPRQKVFSILKQAGFI
ncbi:uncharacterized protein LOC135938176 [Cloeon dipterum]|uniref:uncharacterized protein LOC135938176 n=1 Tax=Cloeon dipterum TaxID=197152 RepID=UPI0032201207